MAREIVKQAVQGRPTRIGESNKRKWEDHQRNTDNNNPNNNNNNNRHFKDKCPKGRNQQNEGARERTYVVVENPQQNPNVVAGTFLLNNYYACILFDSSAEKSFVSSAFTPFIDIAPT
nr:reverse transcriptase domain-containing protein [Tanacetum cinerariifolium]